jgi:hypothetical protein
MDCTTRQAISQDRFVGEFSSILTPPFGCLPLLDHLIRARQHVRRNCQADLFGGFQIDHQLELRRLLYGQVGGFGTFQDSVQLEVERPRSQSTIFTGERTRVLSSDSKRHLRVARGSLRRPLHDGISLKYRR